MKAIVYFSLFWVQFGFGQIIRVSEDSLQIQSPSTPASFYLANDDSISLNISGIRTGNHYYLYYLSIAMADTIIEHIVFLPELDDSLVFEIPGSDSVEITINGIDLCPICKFSNPAETYQDTLFFSNNSIANANARIILYGSFSTGIEEARVPDISRFELLPNYPNPFNPATRIPIVVEKSGDYDLSIYDILGRRVKTLLKTRLVRGNYEYIWDGTDKNGFLVNSGHYYYRLKSGFASQVKTMQFIR